MTTEEEIFKRLDQLEQADAEWMTNPTANLDGVINILYRRVLHLARKRREETGVTYERWPPGSPS